MEDSLERKILKWMASQGTGISSKVMAFTAANIPNQGPFQFNSHPGDTSDFLRCRGLADQIPEIRNAFPRIAKLSPEWNAIISHWDELCDLSDSPVDSGWKTYRRMKNLFAQARAVNPQEAKPNG